jgi:hypothetical protein
MMEKNSFNFKNLNIPIHEDIYSYTNDKQKEIYNYLCQLDEQQKKAYVIAFNHLGSSFNIYKSNGFKSWKISQGK